MKLERLAGPPSSSEGGRSDSFADQALLQRRLALLAGMSFAILFCFYVVGQIMIALGEESRWAPSAHAIYGAAVLVTVLTWLYCRSGSRPLGTLRAVDATYTFLLAGFMLFMPESTIPEKEVRMMVILQAVSLSLFIRSIFLPSTARRTLVVSVLAATPLTAYSLLTETARFSTWKIMWLGAAIAVATAGSAVIWGLRQDVRRARRLGQYTLEEKLGEGGMGLVYRARHAMLRRPTAVKLLRPDRVGESSLRRFEREVQLTAGLSHPNTVSVYDFGRTADGVFYYAMEYLEGLDLDQLVGTDGPQPAGRVVHILRQVLGALAEAHGVGLVHRDVKPSNIILCERGGLPDVAKVVDFGLARDPEAADEQSREGAIIGTPLYLAPEAIRTPQIDGRSDLYSLGAVAFKLLTGTPVFEGRSGRRGLRAPPPHAPAGPVDAASSTSSSRARRVGARVPREGAGRAPTIGSGRGRGARPMPGGRSLDARAGTGVVGPEGRGAASPRGARRGGRNGHDGGSPRPGGLPGTRSARRAI